MQAQQWHITPERSLPPAQCATSFAEVALGYSEAEVLAEADRCLQCLHPLCIDGCPNTNPIPTFIGLVQEGRYADAAAVDYLQNALPTCTGRVCAWERQCEGRCVLNARGEGIRVGAIERFIADYAHQHPEDFEAARARLAAAPGQALPPDSPYAETVTAYLPRPIPDLPPAAAAPHALAGRSVAVVGAGPAGLSCADFLSRQGAAVHIFEAQAQPGGLLADGIPEFVLPAAAVAAEVGRLTRQGVRFQFDTALGTDIEIEELLQRFDAVFVGIGASKARGLDIPGEDARGVYSAQAFLHHAKRALDPASGDAAPEIGGRVLVFGAGNTAMDAARTAVRLGAADVRIVYRRTEAESPSRRVEIGHALAEGVHFDYLVNPVAFLQDGAGRLTAARLIRMRLGAPDASGRRRPEPVPGSEFEMPCDTAVLAVGYSVSGRDLGHPEAVARDGSLRVSGEGGATALPGVFAGGDAARGPATVVEAVADGRRAATAIAAYLAAQEVRSPAGVAAQG